MVSNNPTDVLSTLIQREAVLYAVDVTGCDKREVTDAVPASRSTVDRSIRELEDTGLVTRSADGYRRTLLGELLLSEYYRFKAQTAELLSAGDVFADLPPEADIASPMLDDATIITATQATPHQPISSLGALFTEESDIRLLCPAVFPQLIRAVATAATEQSTAELVLTEPVVTSLVDSHGETLAALREAGTELKLLDATPRYGFAVAEGPTGSTAGLLITDDSGARALIKNSGSEAVAWVTERIDHWCSKTTDLPSQTPGTAE
ncbi:MAG: putative transcriptional regulator [uncultured archaeon A07HN63]|nr:MAG: putative transcriptional regulator [uncultured archaeon A07HN63]